MGIARLRVLDLLPNLCERKFPTWCTICTEFSLTTVFASLEPRLTFGGRGKRAWYTLSAHAPKFPEILGIRVY